MSQVINHRNLIIQWFDRSQKTASFVPSAVDRFVYLWFAFNAWASFNANTYVDRDMVEQFSVSPDATQDYLNLLDNDANFRSKVQRLSEYEVLDMRSPASPGKKIGNLRDLGQLMDIVYQIRCNLFHGKKSLDDPHDMELVELAFAILTKVFRERVDTLRRTN